jgi:hypothetical protein
MKTCVLFNTINHRQENKAKIKHQNLTSKILPVLPLKADLFAVSIEKYRLLVDWI